MEQIELKTGAYPPIIEKAIDMIFAELEKAEDKFPGWPVDPVHGVAIMAEECGETVQAALDYYYERGTKEQVMKEAAQTGAMAIRYLFALLVDKKPEARP
jgi:NTP pyrophosphatase (non-canonical NTP hydrolase)